MGRASRTFRVFVSSTFTDMEAERNALETDVFPGLRALCEERGCAFQAIDLRWGIREEASVEQRAMKICLDEISRCQRLSPRPNFVLLLGDRYGWRPVPDDLSVEEMTALGAAGCPSLEQRYRLDTNAVPPRWVLLPRPANWADVEGQLVADIARAARRAGLSDVRFGGSATEQEAWKGALSVPDSETHVFAFLRSIEGLPSDERAARWSDRSPELAALKDRIRAKLGPNAHDYRARFEGAGISRAHLAAFCEDVQRSLTETILEQISELDDADPAAAEIAAHSAFAQGRRRIFIGRDDAFARLRAHVSAGKRQPVAVIASPGAGKTALLARAAADLSAAGMLVVQRYAGTTAGSSRERALLESIAAELAHATAAALPPVPAGGRDQLAAWFRERLAAVARPAVLVIDALDQLDGVTDAPWLPAELPKGLALIVSAQEGTAVSKTLRGCERITLGPLSKSTGEQIIDARLREAGRTLTRPQRAAVLEKFERDGTPLYLALAFEEARRWRSWDEVPPGAPGADVADAVKRRLQHLSSETEHGPVLVERALGLLAAARAGLAEEELLDLLSEDPEVTHDLHERTHHRPPSPRLPTVLWSRLYADLEPYLSERASGGRRLLNFYHRQIEAVVAAQRPLAPFHAALAQYFERQPFTLGSSVMNARKLSELVFQQANAAQWDALEETLTSPEFLDARCRLRAEVPGIHELAEDCRIAWRLQAEGPRHRIGNLALELEQIALDETAQLMRHPDLALQQLHNRLLGASGAAVELAAKIEAAQRSSGARWFREAGAGFTGPKLLCAERGFEALALDPETGRLAASSDLGVEIWDVERRQQLRSFPRDSGTPVAFAVRWFGPVVAAAHTDGTVDLLDPETGQRVQRLSLDAGLVAMDAAPSRGALFFADRDGARVGHWQPGREAVMGAPRAALSVSCLAVSPDGNTLALGGRATGSVPGLFIAEAWVMEVATGAMRRLRGVPGTQLTALCWDARGDWLACGDSGGGLTVLDSRWDWSVTAWAPGQSELKSSRNDEAGPEMDRWNRDVGEGLVRGGHAHLGGVNGLAVWGSHVLSSGGRSQRGTPNRMPGHVRVVDLPGVSVHADLTVGSRVDDLVPLPDGNIIVAGPGMLALVDAEPDALPRPPPGAFFDVLKPSPDGKALAGSHDLDLLVMGQPSFELPAAHLGEIRALDWHPSGTLLASAGTDEAVRIWDVATRKAVREEELGVELVTVRFSPDGRSLAVAGDGGSCFLLPHGRDVIELRTGKRAALVDVSWDADGNLAACSSEPWVCVWSRREPGERIVKTAHRGPLSGVALLPGGLVATASLDRTCRVHELETGAERLNVRLPEQPTWLLSWPGSASLVVACGSHVVAIDARTGASAHLPGRGAQLAGAARLGETLVVYDAIGGRSRFRLADLPGGET